ncbi:MAG: hypothetical protein ACHQT9_04605 [Candidatus Saccharimonadales bacterium]
MRKQRYLRIFVIIWVIGLTSLSVVNVSATSADISHSYRITSSNIPSGSLVSLDQNKSNYVVLANSDNTSRLLGVAVSKDSSLIVLDPATGTLQVAISGVVNGLVSTVNGPINIGDQITASPFNGVGMKALPGFRIVGIAQSTLNSSSQNVSTQEVTDKNGNKTTIEVGYVRINVTSGSNASGSSLGQNSIQKLAETIAGHPVSNIRIVLSILIALFAIIALSILIYASIHASIIAIGRNPLAQNSVFRTLATALALAAFTAAIACVAIVVILR